MRSRRRGAATGDPARALREGPRRPALALAAVAALAVGLEGASAAGSPEVSVNLPVDHWAYALIERLEARGVLSSVGGGIKPLSRHAVAALALRADSVAHADAGRVTALDTRRVERLLAELAAEAEGLREVRGAADRADGAGLGSPTGTDPPLRYRTDRGDLYGDLLLRQQTDGLSGRGRDEAELVVRNRVGAVLHGHLLGRVGFRVAFEQTREQGSRDYREREDVYDRRLEAVQLKGKMADYHQGASYVTFSLGRYVDVEVGKDEVEWGPAPRDNLGLSANAPTFDMVRLQSRFGALHLVSLHGALRPCPPRPDSPLCAQPEDADTLRRPWLWPGADAGASYVANGQSRVLDREKWIAAHRVEAAVTPWLDLGYQEVVVYGDRGPEPAYLNPIALYWAAQSYLGDKDNVMMAVDAGLHPGHGVRLWAAYAIDDLKKLKVFSDDFANKFSLQAGALWTDPFGLRDVDARGEYVRVEPWIYTHKYPVNTFSHFDSPLGHSLGPNSDRWTLSAARRWTAELATSVSLSRARHGDNVLVSPDSVLNVGGDLFLGPRPQDATATKRFLDGVVGRRTALGAGLDWRPLPRLLVRIGADVEWGRGVPLPPRDGPAVPLDRRTGYGDGRQQHLALEARYGVF